MQKQYRSADVSKLFDVTIATIGNWIKDGELQAYETVGGHYRFEAADILAFAKKNKMPLPADFKNLVPTAGCKYKVLLVDDEARIIEIMTDILKDLADDLDETIGIETAFSAVEAGVKISEFVPDLVILDGRMPGGHGSDVCREIKTNERFKGVKVLAYTAYSDESKKLQKAGADSVIMKAGGGDELNILRREISRFLGVKVLKIKIKGNEHKKK
ncbi:MAG: response regulator [Candidatus Firestonebacteria bacterium]